MIRKEEKSMTLLENMEFADLGMSYHLEFSPDYAVG